MKTTTVEDLCQRFDDVEKWLEAGEEVALTRDGVVVARMIAPPEPRQSLPPLGKADWARRFRERPPVGRNKPLTVEETAAFLESLKRDF